MFNDVVTHDLMLYVVTVVDIHPSDDYACQAFILLLNSNDKSLHQLSADFILEIHFKCRE